eukprot:1679127-Pleurochrysis_carterae.AAC.1
MRAMTSSRSRKNSPRPMQSCRQSRLHVVLEGGAGKGHGRGRGRGRGSAGRGRGQANDADAADESSDEDSDAIDSEQEEGTAECNWLRNDLYSLNERSRQGFHHEHAPMLSFTNATTMPFFKFCMQRFDGKFLSDMAAEMQQVGQDKGARWAAWK